VDGKIWIFSKLVSVLTIVHFLVAFRFFIKTEFGSNWGWIIPKNPNLMIVLLLTFLSLGTAARQPS